MPGSSGFGGCELEPSLLELLVEPIAVRDPLGPEHEKSAALRLWRL